MPMQTRCTCTLCLSGYYDSDIDKMIWGVANTEDGEIQLAPCSAAGRHVCVLCVGQIQATKFKHWVLDHGVGTPVAVFQ